MILALLILFIYLLKWTGFPPTPKSLLFGCPCTLLLARASKRKVPSSTCFVWSCCHHCTSLIFWNGINLLFIKLPDQTDLTIALQKEIKIIMSVSYWVNNRLWLYTINQCAVSQRNWQTLSCPHARNTALAHFCALQQLTEFLLSLKRQLIRLVELHLEQLKHSQHKLESPSGSGGNTADKSASGIKWNKGGGALLGVYNML